MKELTTEIEIAASPARVWQVLTDFEGHSDWNPFMTRITGKAAKDEKLEIVMPNPEGGTMVISPTILAVDKEKELRWLGRSEGDAFVGEHSFILTPTGENRVHLTHSEKFTGPMVAALEGWLDTEVRRQFEAMNKALKARSEQG